MSLATEAWTRRVATAPQFHGTTSSRKVVAFNLLMGRRWPPNDDDWEEAEAVCEELGLGPLLTRMPSGMNPSGGIARRDVLEPNEELRKGVVERHMELFSAMRRPSLGYS